MASNWISLCVGFIARKVDPMVLKSCKRMNFVGWGGSKKSELGRQPPNMQAVTAIRPATPKLDLQPPKIRATTPKIVEFWHVPLLMEILRIHKFLFQKICLNFVHAREFFCLILLMATLRNHQNLDWDNSPESLNLILSQFVNWFNPCGNKIRGKVKLTGVFSFTCLNLLPSLQNKISNICRAALARYKHYQPSLGANSR
ncbi:hypothetical protein VP01_2621g1 [Puccinia sorghi]|uniref:Uncharacterized protein n=1 Tax=Puccinia sorghi TaxID=27349 RepID=A0A0L6V533_9BASI|nr:hypothetical protein VP01_2621g1 [Puccinia sorghi]